LADVVVLPEPAGAWTMNERVGSSASRRAAVSGGPQCELQPEPLHRSAFLHGGLTDILYQRH
jgi:hypothetical protein